MPAPPPAGAHVGGAGSRGCRRRRWPGCSGSSQARVSQIEHGQVDSLDNLRAYAAAIGGEVEVTVRQGDRTIKVA